MVKKDFMGALIASCVSIFAYQTGFFFFLFLVPLQLLMFRSGLRTARIAVLGVGVALAYLGIRHTYGMDASVKGMLLLVELSIPFLLLGGFLLANGSFGELGGVLRNILLATVITACLSVVIIYALDNDTFCNYYKKQFSELLVPLVDADVDTVLVYVSKVFYRGFLFAYFCILFVSYIFALSVDRLIKHQFGIITVMVPDYFIWVLVVALSLILVDAKIGLSQFLESIGWNVFLIVMFLYGLKGMGMIRQILEVKKVPFMLRSLLSLLCVMLLLTPRYGLLLLIGIPCIGVSEIWFKCKRT